MHIAYHTNEPSSGSGVHDGRLETVEARDKIYSAIILQPGHYVTGGGNVLIQTNTPGCKHHHTGCEHGEYIILCPLHHHPSVVDAALRQVLGLNVPLLRCLPSDWLIMITRPEYWALIGQYLGILQATRGIRPLSEAWGESVTTSRKEPVPIVILAEPVR